MQNKIFLLLLFCSGLYTQLPFGAPSNGTALNAQQLLIPSFSFSGKKTAYVTLLDGTEISGRIQDIDRKKGLIEFIQIQDSTGKKHKLKPETVHHMYLPPSGADALGKGYEEAFNTQRWNDEKLQSDLLRDGYVYFESVDVTLKKGTERLLMQLLNPAYSKHIKIYHDPRAAETTSVGIGGFTMAGGDAKSYYVTKGDKPAVRLFKSDYKEQFQDLWGDCPEVKKKFSDMRWSELDQHALAYSECKG